jgi:hypothetical protein
MKSRELCKKEWVEWAIKNGINLTREEVEAGVQKYNDIVTQTVPWNGGARLKPLKPIPVGIVSNNTDRMTKWRTDQICFPRDLNIHDPDNKYRWQEEEAQAPAWVWAMRGLGVVGFVVGIYCLTLLTFLF